jgi:protein SCO1/2
MAPNVGLQAGPAAGSGVKRSEHHYALPSVRLIGADGKPLPLGRVLDEGRPVVLTFLYTSCTTICPINSQVLTAFTELLGQEASRVNVVSVSIDPDHDTVARLTSHARRNALSGAFYTGDPAASEAVQRAFEAWRGDKMNHEAVIFLRAPGQATWVRLDGLVSPQRLLSEYRQLVPS